MKSALLLALILTTAAATASICDDCDIRMGNKILQIGLSESAVVDIAGVPTVRIPLVNGFNAPIGTKLIYREKGYNKRTIVLILDSNGRVSHLNEYIGIEADQH